ncbi:tail fiber protein [Flavobacterium defluvii]|uniref:Uncharacterized protein n=1 Tax=Flavobacterium defluvii TaxID=370979 RepID=A0A1M5WKQ2_9FLAO|nr:tail fiber protein [Flavobacterium defluvii]SHH88018.1 hypothetical protein SAMN05443663_11442 [Flavobacterium defluvii]
MSKRLKFIYLIILCLPLYINAQVTTTPLAGNYKIIDIGGNGGGDYTRNLILLHEMYDGTLLNMNNAVGTITAFRGAATAGNRINVLEINSSSSYNSTTASVKSVDNMSYWTLKTCTYNGKKYLAVDVPYSNAYHNWGFKFCGWTTSTGENMKSVAYQINGASVNTDVLSNIQDFVPNLTETHLVSNFLVMGNVGIGTTAPDEKLTVKGKIHTQEVKVDLLGALVPDYVFENDYQLKTLEEVEKYIKENKHLPEIPSAQEIEKNGLMLAEMNMALLKKMEEMTLYMIEQNKKIEVLEKKIESITRK